MSKIRKVYGIGIVLIFVMTIFVACGTKKASASKDFEFSYKGDTVTIDDDATKMLKDIGKAKETKKTESCAFQGYDRTYVYDDFTITTYSKTKSGSEFINSIELTKDSVATKENIKIGSSKKDMLDVYGTVKDKFGVYTYTKGKTKLVIEVDDSDKVISIKYMKK